MSLKGSSQFDAVAYYKKLTIVWNGSFSWLSDDLMDQMILAKSELSCLKLTFQKWRMMMMYFGYLLQFS